MSKARKIHGIMGGMNQKKLEKPYFHCGLFWKWKYEKKVKYFKEKNYKNGQNK